MFILPDDPRWARALARTDHDFYHLPSYAEVCAREESGAEPLAYLFEDGEDAMLLPLLRRPVPGSTASDAVSPYGYSCPVFTAGADEDFQARALQAFVAEGAREGLISTFVRLHPLVQPSVPADPAGRWSVVTHGPTIALDTVEPEEAWFPRLSTNHRRNVRRLRRDGFTVRFDAPGDLEVFRRVYSETMDRVAAAGHYYFSEAYYDGLAAALGDRLLTAAVVSPDGDVAAAGLFVLTGTLGEYHLGGTAEAFLNVGPSKLMFVAVREEMGRRGASVLNLGGGAGAEEDSLFLFKAAFAGTRGTFRSLRVVHDEAAYAAETRRTSLALGEPEGRGAAHFPEYRRTS